MDTLTREQADTYLKERWNEQSDKLLTFANNIPLPLYLRANRPHVMSRSFAENARSPFVQRALASQLPPKAY